MLQPKRTAYCRLAKIFIQHNVVLCCLTNLFIVHRIQQPRTLDKHWPWAVYTRSCSVSFSEISLAWDGTCLLPYDNLCLVCSIILCFPLSVLLFSISFFFLSVTGFVFLSLFFGHNDYVFYIWLFNLFCFFFFFFSVCESTSSAFVGTYWKKPIST